jgi:hypothetical protein
MKVTRSSQHLLIEKEIHSNHERRSDYQDPKIQAQSSSCSQAGVFYSWQFCALRPGRGISVVRLAMGRTLVVVVVVVVVQ